MPDAGKEIIKAAKAGAIENVKRLLAADADLVHARDSDGSTPLHCACWKGHQEVVALLSSAGADANAKNQNAHWGTTPLHAAAHANQASIAQLLIEHGADAHAQDLEATIGSGTGLTDDVRNSQETGAHSMAGPAVPEKDQERTAGTDFQLAGPWRWPDVAMPLVWILLLSATLATPIVVQSATLGDDLTRSSVRLALVYYALAINLMLFLRPSEWTALSDRGWFARWCWTLSWATFLVHLGMAFHFYHHWSHADAVEHTRSVSGLGEGIYFSYFFTLLWTADVAFWWLWPARYATRPRWIDVLLHGFMLFIIFNGTVIFEQGPIRWAGILFFVELAAASVYRWNLGSKRISFHHK